MAKRIKPPINMERKGLSGRDLRRLLDPTVGKGTKVEGIFGIAYSVISYRGLVKGFGLSLTGVRKIAEKAIVDGHATTVMIDYKKQKFCTTGMSDEGWVFNEYRLDRPFARKTPNSNTDIYYTELTSEQISKYWAIKEELEKLESPAKYSVCMPNIIGRTRYENCVSSSHYISYKMGFGVWASTKGMWIPSMSNYMTWAATKASSWKHKRIPNSNTLLRE